MKSISILALTLALTACGTYQHSRPVNLSITVVDGKTNIVVAAERTTVRVLFQKIDATKMQSTVKDGDYSRTLTFGQIGATGDAKTINAIAEGVANGMIKAQTGGAGIPSLPSLNAVSPKN